MEVNNENPSEMNRFHLDKMLKTEIVELHKKRKLQAEQLGLPVPKHKCCARSFCCGPVYLFDENPKLESLRTHMIKEKTEVTVLVDASENKSAKDSNSFAEESDSGMSVNEETKFDAESSRTYVHDWPSTSSVNCEGDCLNDPHYISDGLPVEKTGYREGKLSFMSGEHHPSHDDPDIQALQNLDEYLLEFGNPIEYLSTEYGNRSIEKCLDKDFEDILCSNGANPNMHVLSSGQWTIDQEAQSGPRAPTIDQEFEQYFSMLLL
ncbi:Protein FAR-RED ELONGATED HYPOCOTYL 1 [Quillaja saponaria]|uniref:Protein FAR-RED ELONGATED HYPOCOTYL 1 n=1 Tax=Quillaja saponaria TaxID=32244 RepID=A0AAD7L2E4_QUISA|nr:Protein FAR-RED ELONGATED HYPOCOTYL 1 [Quillaja saponaria]